MEQSSVNAQQKKMFNIKMIYAITDSYQEKGYLPSRYSLFLKQLMNHFLWYSCVSSSASLSIFIDMLKADIFIPHRYSWWYILTAEIKSSGLVLFCFVLWRNLAKNSYLQLLCYLDCQVKDKEQWGQSRKWR